MVKAVLFDADGVLTLPEDVFSVMYTKSRGLDPKPFEAFFKNEWSDFVLGKRDLKQHIASNPQLWRWDGTPDALLDYWFKAEDKRNTEMLDIVQKIRAKGIKCYVATEQEFYRTRYMRDVMFFNKFDGFFPTCEVGYRKNDIKFYENILSKLNDELSDIKPAEVVFFDDSHKNVQIALSVCIDARFYTNNNQVKTLIN